MGLSSRLGYPWLLETLQDLRQHSTDGCFRSVARVRHDVSVAAIAAALAGDLCPRRVESARLAGLLHDIGEHLLIRLLGLEGDRESSDDSPEEDRRLRADHASVGAWACRQVGFSPDIVRAVESHHRLDPPIGSLERCVWLAEAITHADDSEEGYRRAIAAAEAVGVSRERVEILAAISSGSCSVASALSMNRVDNPLAPRQRQIMRLLAAGVAPPEIAVRLRIARSTVHNTLSQIYRKLGVRDSVQAVLLCERQGWL